MNTCRPLAAALLLLASALVTAGHHHPPCVGATTRAFLNLMSRRGAEPRVLGPNEWAEDGIEPQHASVGFCPWVVQRHRSHPHTIEFVCVAADSRTGCWQQYEQEGDTTVRAGCVYVPHRDSISASAE